MTAYIRNTQIPSELLKVGPVSQGVWCGDQWNRGDGVYINNCSRTSVPKLQSDQRWFQAEQRRHTKASGFGFNSPSFSIFWQILLPTSGHMTTAHMRVRTHRNLVSSVIAPPFFFLRENGPVVVSWSKSMTRCCESLQWCCLATWLRWQVLHTLVLWQITEICVDLASC